MSEKNEVERRMGSQRILSFAILLLLVSFGAALSMSAGAAFAGVPRGVVSAVQVPEQGTPTATPMASATAVCPSGWTGYPNPAPPGESTLHAVQAFSPTDLWAVGESGATPQNSLIVHGNGTSWTQVSSPNPVTATQVSLLGVGGVAANDVWAVGYYNYQYTLIEHWDGLGWSIVPSPSIYSYDRLYAVTAIASNDVWAVGTYDYGPTKALFEHWDGTRWSVVPDPSCLCDNYYINGVTAVAANDVWAVGTRIMHWDGSSWSFVLAAGWLNSVTAVAANDIWAVGWHIVNGQNNTLVMHWDGSTWSTSPSPSPGATTNHLYGLSVRAANDIWAVGDTDQGSGGTQVLAEHWDGSAWTVVATPDNPTGGDHFYGVAATGDGSVWAVGASGCSSGCNQNALIMRYGPQCSTPTPTPPPCGLTWRTVLSPSPGAHSELYSVAVVAANDIWAVGASSTTGGRLIEHWDGTTWSIVPSPAVPDSNGPQRSVPEQARYEGLYGISAVSAHDIWTVGFGAVIEHWDGTTWSIVPNPGGDTLNGVVALASNDVWAVGSSSGGLIEHWDGTQWSIVPNPSPGGSYLSAVAAVAANDIWAVGEQGSPWQMLSEHWDGTRWSLVSIPTPGAAYNKMRGVAAVSANDVWAVGDYSDCWTCPELTVTEHWDGTQWSIVPSPSPGSADNELWGIVSVGGAHNDVWAVGILYPAPDDHTLVEHWDGSSWSVVPNSQLGVLYAVGVVASSDLWAVGIRPGPANEISLTQHYHDPCAGATATATSSPTRTVLPTGTRTPPVTGTATPSPTTTAGPTSTATACAIPFTDVHPSDYFYAAVTYLYCHAVISGYDDHTFRPYNHTTRGQLAKIVVLGFGLPIWTPSPSAPATFSDVPPGNPFYEYVETAAHDNIVSGYADGTFRPFNNVTRGQLAKIIVVGATIGNGWPLLNPPTPTFSDAPPNSPFYTYIETASCHQLVSGYSDGTFRPGAAATRGQISKIQYRAILNTAVCAVTPTAVVPKR